MSTATGVITYPNPSRLISRKTFDQYASSGVVVVEDARKRERQRGKEGRRRRSFWRWLYVVTSDFRAGSPALHRIPSWSNIYVSFLSSSSSTVGKLLLLLHFLPGSLVGESFFSYSQKSDILTQFTIIQVLTAHAWKQVFIFPWCPNLFPQIFRILGHISGDLK